MSVITNNLIQISLALESSLNNANKSGDDSEFIEMTREVIQLVDSITKLIHTACIKPTINENEVNDILKELFKRGEENNE